MNNWDKKIWCLYALAILIPLTFLTHLDWRANNPAWQERDIYFGADCNRVINDLQDDFTENKEGLVAHTRDNLHPYFSLFAVTVSKVGQTLGYQNIEFSIYRTVFGSLGIFLFWLFIFKQTNTTQAFSALVLLMSSMTFRVWMAVPDTFIFSFTTLMLSLNLIRINVKPEYVLLSSMTGALSNITLGFFNLLFNTKKLKDAVKVIGVFLVLALMLSIIQQIIYPTSSHFFEPGIVYESAHIKTHQSISFMFFKVFDFFVSGFLLPLSPNIVMPVSTDGLWSSFISANHSKRFLLQTFLTFSLLGLLYISTIFAFIKRAKDDKVGITILLYIGFELLFHLVYGDPPFLYSLNFLPMIIIVFSLYQVEKLKRFGPFLFLLMAIAIQNFSIPEVRLFNQYFL